MLKMLKVSGWRLVWDNAIPMHSFVFWLAIKRYSLLEIDLLHGATLELCHVFSAKIKLRAGIMSQNLVSSASGLYAAYKTFNWCDIIQWGC